MLSMHSFAKYRIRRRCHGGMGYVGTTYPTNLFLIGNESERRFGSTEYGTQVTKNMSEEQFGGS